MDLKSRMKLEKMAYATEQTTLKATKFLQTVDKYASAVDNLHAYTIILKEICKNKKAMEIWQQIESQHDIYTSLLEERENKNIDEKIITEAWQDVLCSIKELRETVGEQCEEKLGSKISKLSHDEQEAIAKKINTTSADALDTLMEFGFTEPQIQFIVNDIAKNVNTDVLHPTKQQIEKEDEEFRTVENFIKNIKTVQGHDDEEVRSMYTILLSYVGRSDSLLNQIESKTGIMQIASSHRGTNYNLNTNSSTPRSDSYVNLLTASIFSQDPVANERNRAIIMQYAAQNGVDLNEAYFNFVNSEQNSGGKK